MKGTALIKLSGPYSHLAEPITKLQAMSSGCADFVLTKHDIQLKGGFILHLAATVTEDGSNQLESESGRLHVTDQNYILDFSKGPPYFKSGLPYHGVLRLVEVAVPLKGEMIQICYNLAIRKTWNIKKNQQCSNFTLNGQETVVNFHILPVRESTVQIHLTAKSLNARKSDQEQTKIISTSFILKRWYSPSNSFLHLEQNSSPIAKCRSPLQFTVYYTTEKLTDGENVTLYYMVC